MRTNVLIDTGPLVAFLNRRDRYHPWAVSQLSAIEPPLHTCEAVLSEASFLLRRYPGGGNAALELLHRGLIQIGMRLDQEIDAIRRLSMRFADQPISLADACLVRLAELRSGSRVLTLDSDFRVYRMHGRQVIPTLMPS